MNRNLLTMAFLFFFPVLSFGQPAADAIEEKSQQTFFQEDIKEQFISYDFTRLIIPGEDFLGFIGSNYRRIHIYYNSVKKDLSDPFLYHIKGVSVVGSNKCDFTGSIRIQNIHKAKKMELGINSMYANAGFKSQGILKAGYIFNEDSTQHHVGTFTGDMTIAWLIDKHGIVHINDVNSYANNYRNNQHTGTWTQYGASESKTCNFGVRRIPKAGELDIGAAAFSVNPRYRDMGWDAFPAK